MHIDDLDLINRYVLSKQYLLPETKTDDIVEITDNIGGLHAPVSKTPFLSLLARSNTFNEAQLIEKLEDKSFVKVKCLRASLYVLSAATLPIYYTATEKMVVAKSAKQLKQLSLSPEETDYLIDEVIELLRKGKGMTSLEINKILESQHNISPVIHYLCDKAQLIRGNPPKGWKSGNHAYYLFDSYLPNIKLNQYDEAQALELMIKQYIKAYSPVSDKDIIWWSGLSRVKVVRTLDAIADSLTTLRISNLNEDFIIFKDEQQKLEGFTKSDQPVITFLPAQDSYVVAYKIRDRYLSKDYFDNVYDRSGNATSVILVDGWISGVWDLLDSDEPWLKFYLFDNVTDALTELIHDEAEIVGKQITGKTVKVEECYSMIPLNEKNANDYLTPLK